jgi:protein gp37
MYKRYADGVIRKAPYPFEFAPTFHAYKLEEPIRRKKPATIFVCSMAICSGNGYQDNGSSRYSTPARQQPWHNYLFLTKNPQRTVTCDAGKLPELDNFWYGSTITKPGECMVAGSIHWNTFPQHRAATRTLDVGIGSFGGPSGSLSEQKPETAPERSNLSARGSKASSRLQD